MIREILQDNSFYKHNIIKGFNLKKMNSAKVSQCRTVLMGIAILAVMLHHTHMEIPLVSKIGHFGYWGVDIFFFVSGLGIFYSLQHHATMKEYLLKRFSRIIPVYWLVISIFSIWKIFTHTGTWNDWFMNLFGLNYWLDRPSRVDWFIPVICLFYLLAPIFARFIKKGHGVAAISIVSLVCLGVPLVLPMLDAWHLSQCILRFPVFLGGMYFAYLTMKEVVLPKWTLPVCAAIFMVAFVGEAFAMRMLTPHFMFQYGIYFYFSAIGAIPLTLLLSSIIRSDAKYWAIPAYCGGMTLELYMLHERIIVCMQHYYPNLFSGIGWGYVPAFLLSVAGAIVLMKLRTLLQNDARRRGHGQPTAG